MIVRLQENHRLTEISDGIFEVCEVDIRCKITFTWSVEHIDNFMVFERLQRLISELGPRQDSALD